jgi:hypothetical protein
MGRSAALRSSASLAQDMVFILTVSRTRLEETLR